MSKKRIDWTQLNKDWGEYWLTWNVNPYDYQTRVDAFWEPRGGRDRYFIKNGEGLDVPREFFESPEDEAVSSESPSELYPTHPSGEERMNPKQYIKYTDLPVLDDEATPLLFGKNAKILKCVGIDGHYEGAITVCRQDEDFTRNPDGTEKDLVPHYFRTLEFGQEVPVGYSYVDTVTLMDGRIRHVYVLIDR